MNNKSAFRQLRIATLSPELHLGASPLQQQKCTAHLAACYCNMWQATLGVTHQRDLMLVQREPQSHAVAGLLLLMRLAFSSCAGCCCFIRHKVHPSQTPVRPSELQNRNELFATGYVTGGTGTVDSPACTRLELCSSI